MHNNNILKSIILKVVEAQLASNRPKATRETFERLVTEGYGKRTAKEMIAAAITEDIYYMFKDKRKFDEEEFTQKLSKLGKRK